MKKRRGHYCRICGSLKPNEAFSGKGHPIHVCKKCARLPKEEREEIECTDEVFNYLRQSHISDKNVSRLRELAVSPNEHIAELAGIVLEVAEIKPYKKRRLKGLARKRRDLLYRLEETGLQLSQGEAPIPIRLGWGWSRPLSTHGSVPHTLLDTIVLLEPA